MDPSSEKTFLRKMLFKKRKKIPEKLRLKKSRGIFRQIFRDPAYREAGRVAVYFGIPPEVETKPFLAKMLKQKEVFLPRVDGRKKILILHRVLALARDLRKETYSIMEPKLWCPKQPAAAMDLIIVPGVGFDKKGNRLGRGAGYYDGLLKNAPGVHKIGICFREQIVKKIPMTKRDVPVDQVITD